MSLRSLGILSCLVLFLFWYAFGRSDVLVRADSRSASSSFEPSVEPKPGPQKLSASGEASLRDVLNAGLLPDLHSPNFTKYRNDVVAFYGGFRDALPWLDQGKPTAEARAVIHALQNSAYKGLRPEDYDGPEWDARIAKFDGPTSIAETDLLKFDLAVTICAMRYVSDLHMGRVNPQLFHFGLDIDHQQIALSDFLSQRLVGAADVDAVLATVEPPFPIYPRTQAALKKYIEFVRTDDGETLPASSRAVKPGDPYAGVPRLAKLLALLGDLPAGNAAVYKEGAYQGSLIDGVKHFQRRHGLAPDGILDVPTLKELNTPLAIRVMQLQLAMERMRWLPHQFSRPPVIVNIPEFRLYALNEKDLTAFTMNVVVGKAYGHQTPVFANEIRSVVFRPYWNVPQSIVDAEMIPKLKKDSSYLSKNSLEIVDKDEKVVSEDPANQETLAHLRAGKLRIRQTPGPENSLGLVKFEFPNQYAVYMHSTPAKELFSRTRRDFSHGCIRLEDPPKLASWVLQGMPEWTDERIQAAMNGEETVQVRLKDPIPVLIFYSTAVVLEGEEPHFFEDIYGLDAELEKALALNVEDSALTGPSVKK